MRGYNVQIYKKKQSLTISPYLLEIALRKLHESGAEKIDAGNYAFAAVDLGKFVFHSAERAADYPDEVALYQRFGIHSDRRVRMLHHHTERLHLVFGHHSRTPGGTVHHIGVHAVNGLKDSATGQFVGPDEYDYISGLTTDGGTKTLPSYRGQLTREDLLNIYKLAE